MSLFETKKEVFIFFITLLVITGINLFFEFSNYQNLKTSKFQTIQARVLNQYTKLDKRDKIYTVLKLKNENFEFYTSTKSEIKDLKNRDITLSIITKEIDFISYLKGFYAPSFRYELLPKEEDFKSNLEQLISNSHKQTLTKELFLALFLAKPISKELREEIQKWGISHLIALSGYHIGIFFSILFGLFYLLYRPLQDRYFPYRNRNIDLFILIHLLIGYYVYMLGVVPSLLRAYIMSLFVFFLYLRGIKILSITSLFILVCLILAFFPKLIFSIGFFFSVSGVYYIYLYLRYFSHLNRWLSFVLLNFWISILIIPIVHFFFPVITILHLFAPLVTMVFTLFYPLEMFLHLIGFGDLLDDFIIYFLQIEVSTYNLEIPFWFFISHIIASIVLYFLPLTKKKSSLYPQKQ